MAVSGSTRPVLRTHTATVSNSHSDNRNRTRTHYPWQHFASLFTICQASLYKGCLILSTGKMPTIPKAYTASVCPAAIQNCTLQSCCIRPTKEHHASLEKAHQVTARLSSVHAQAGAVRSGVWATCKHCR